jgi:LTXXQ motif family protein
MIEAVELMRSPLGSFYDRLTDEQKKRFDTMEGSGKAATERANLTALCGSQSGNVAKLPFERIALLVKPDAQQQQAFDDLKKASADAADTLQTSCPAAMPQTPAARLDVVKTRLASMTDALKIIRPKLEAFYNSLNDEQKARFNIMGPPSQASSLQQQKGG